MDCEKFESALMDELYGELDELTSAAMNRHVAGCARCASLLGGLRATRRVAALPMADAPEGLEGRILAATANIRPIVPMGLRLARAVSLAGSWAMRPQTAMAAVFLVMIGTSVLLLRGKSSRAPASAEMTVTEEGTPAPATPPAFAEPTVTVAANAAPAASAGSSAPAVATRQAERSLVASAPASPPSDYAQADDGRRRAVAKAAPAKDDDGLGSLALNGATGVSGGGAPMRATQPYAAAPAPMMAPAPAATASPGGAAGPRQDFAAPPAADAPEAEAAPAPPVDPSAELLAARTARDTAARQGHPCPSGPRFDDVASRASGTQPGWDALFEGALCYESLGDWSSARSRLGALLGVDSHRYRARAELDRLNKIQYARGSGALPRAAKPASPPAEGAPAAPPSPPASPAPPSTGANSVP